MNQGAEKTEVAVWREHFKVHSFEVDFKSLGTPENLCRHFQEAAWNHAEHLGVGYERLRQENKIWVLSRLLLRFDRHARWGETIAVHTWPRQARSVFALRDFEMFGSDGARLVAGASAWLVLNATTRKPQRVDKLVSSIESFCEKRALEQEPEKLEAMAPQPSVTQRTVCYSDIDVNGHVNNARYIGWILDSYAIDFHRTHAIRLMEINYEGETTSGERISISSCENGHGDYRHSIVKEESGIEVCRAKLLWTTTSPSD